MNLDVLYAFKCLAPVLIWTDVLERVRKASAWLAKIMAEDTIYTYFIGYLSLTQGTDSSWEDYWPKKKADRLIG